MLDKSAAEVQEAPDSNTQQRGRKPGQLKGVHYNVMKRKQISVSLYEKEIDLIDKLAKEENVTRSRVIHNLITSHPILLAYKQEENG